MRFFGLACLACCICLPPAAGAPAGRAEAGEKIFAFEVVSTRGLGGWFSSEGEITVDWGDGTRETFSGRRQRYFKDYGEPVNAAVRVYAAGKEALKEFRMDESGADISFDLKHLPPEVSYLNLLGDNTVTGVLADIPAVMEYFNCRGKNTISGDIGDLPEGLNRFYLRGENTVEGDVKDLPRGLGHFGCHGRNTVTGDIKELPPFLSHLVCFGANTLKGDLRDLPDRLVRFNVLGRNTITGDLKDLPPWLTQFWILGRNTVGGDIKNLPFRLTHFYCGSTNKVSGDIAELPEDLVYFSSSGGTAISSYTSGREWAGDMLNFSFSPSSEYGLSTGEVDDLLIDLSATTWSGSKSLRLAGGNAARSARSDEAVRKLGEMGVSVDLN